MNLGLRIPHRTMAADDFPCTAESIELAKLEADAERAKAAAALIDQGALYLVRRLGLPLDGISAEQWGRVDGIEALSNLTDRLIETHGRERVCKWLRNMVTMKGGR